MPPAFWTMRVDRAPCADGVHHTSYLLLTEGPGHVYAFPESNFRLTTAEHQRAQRQLVAELGLTLVLEDEPDADEAGR